MQKWTKVTTKVTIKENGYELGEGAQNDEEILQEDRIRTYKNLRLFRLSDYVIWSVFSE